MSLLVFVEESITFRKVGQFFRCIDTHFKISVETTIFLKKKSEHDLKLLCIRQPIGLEYDRWNGGITRTNWLTLDEL